MAAQSLRSAYFGRRIANIGSLAVRASSRSENSDAVAQSGDNDRLIEGQPVLDAVANCIEHDFGVIFVVFDDFFEVKPSFISAKLIELIFCMMLLLLTCGVALQADPSGTR